MKLRMMSVAMMALAAFGACKKSNDNNATNATDKQYVTMAAMSNYAEISAGKLAVSKTADPMVSAFAQKMISDHTNAQDTLQMLAGQLGLYAPDSLDAAHVQMAAMLSAMSGRAFDSAYVHGQVTDHQNTVNLFQTESASGSNSQVKTFESVHMPIIQMHLMMADSLAANY